MANIVAWIKDNWAEIVKLFDKIFEIVEAIIAK